MADNMDRKQTGMKNKQASQGPVFTMDVEPLKQALPSSADGCMEMMYKFYVGMGCFNTLAYWTLGRIVLEKRSTFPEIVEKLKEEFQFKTRTMEYAVQLFKRFPEPELVFDLAKLGVSWTGFKHLSSIQDDDERKQLVEKIKNEEVDPKEVNQADKNKDSGPVDVDTSGDDSGGEEDPHKDLLAYYRTLAKKMTKFREELDEMMLDFPSREDQVENDDSLDVDTIDRIYNFRATMVNERKLINHSMGGIPDE